MSEEDKSSKNRNPYVPYILPEWKDECRSDKQQQKMLKVIQLTDENASKYASIPSHVGWKKRVDYAMKYLETQNNNQDSGRIACLLENVVSTVIVLASSKTISDEYLLNSYLFLRKVRNEFGENPPNIAGFMEFLKTKASEEILSVIKSVEDSEIEKLPSNLTITRVSKNYRAKENN